MKAPTLLFCWCWSTFQHYQGLSTGLQMLCRQRLGLRFLLLLQGVVVVNTVQLGPPGTSAVLNTHHRGPFSVCYNWMKGRVALVREAFPMEGTAASVNAWRHTRPVHSGKYWIVWDRVSYSTGWPPTCYMAEASLDYPIFTTQGLGLQVCLSKPGRKYSLVPRVGVTPQS